MFTAIRNRQDLRTVGWKSGIALFAFVGRSLQQISALAMTFMAARFLAPADFGTYSLGITFIILIQTLTYTGFYQFILTSKEDDALVLSTCFWLIVGLVSLASALLAALAYPLQWLFGAESLAGVLIWLAAVQPLASIGAWSSAALLRRGAVTMNFVIMFAQNFVALVGGVVLLWYWHSLYALVAFRYLRVVAGAALYAVFARDWPSFLLRRDLAVKAAAFSGGLFASRGLGFLSRYAADLLLGLLHSPAAVGLYRFGNRVATGATDVLTQPMSNFASTQFGAAARKDRSLATPLTRFSGTISLLTGIVSAVIIVFAQDAITLFFRPAYLPALVVTYAMALRGVAGIGQLLIEPALAAADRTAWVMYYNLVSAVVSVLAIFAASPWGLEMLAWSQLAVTFGSTIWAFAILRDRAGIAIGPAWRNYIAALAVSAVYGMLLYSARTWLLPLLPHAPLEQFCIGLGLAAVLALVTIAIGAALRIFTLDAFSG